MAMGETADRRPEWLKRKHGKQRSEPYTDLLASAPPHRSRKDSRVPGRTAPPPAGERWSVRGGVTVTDALRALPRGPAAGRRTSAAADEDRWCATAG